MEVETVKCKLSYFTRQCSFWSSVHSQAIAWSEVPCIQQEDTCFCQCSVCKSPPFGLQEVYLALYQTVSMKSFFVQLIWTRLQGPCSLLQGSVTGKLCLSDCTLLVMVYLSNNSICLKRKVLPWSTLISTNTSKYTLVKQDCAVYALFCCRV